MKDLSSRVSDYFDFLWRASKIVIDEYLLTKYPELSAYVHPRGATSTLLIAAHFAVLSQRDEMFGSDGEFDIFADDAAEIDDYIAHSINAGGVKSGLPDDIYHKMIQSIKSNVNYDALWLLADMGGGGKKGRVIAIHSQIGNFILGSFFRGRGATVAEMGDAGNVLNRLFASCYTKYAETLGFDEALYDDSMRGDNVPSPSVRPKIDSLSSPEHPFISSLVEHAASAELTSNGHEAPVIGLATGYAVDYFNGYFSQMNANVRQVGEDDVQDFCEKLDEYVLQYAPAVVDKYLSDPSKYIWEFGLHKGEMVASILNEVIEDMKNVEKQIIEMTNDFIDRFLEDGVRIPY